MSSPMADRGIQDTGPSSKSVRCFLDLSTAHLPPGDRLYLEFSANPGALGGIAAMAGTYGWFVYAHDERCCDGISDVLWAIFERARAMGCAYVLFDADAAVMDDLPVFEDETAGAQK